MPKPKTITLVGRAGLECPKCKSRGLFNYPASYGKKYGPKKFYCETCDPGHRNPVILK